MSLLTPSSKVGVGIVWRRLLYAGYCRLGMDATVVQVFTSRPSGGLTAKRAGVLCAFIAVCLYANTLDCGFCYDDDRAVKSNVDLRPYSPWTGLLWHDFWGTLLNNPASHKSYRPLTVATFRLNYLVHGLQPMGYHLVNVLLHGAVCFLYAVLCAAVFGGVGPALLAGLLFAVHPIHTEAVAGVVGRTELLSAVFFLGALFAYRRHSQLSNSSGSRVFSSSLLLSMLLSVCSMLSKEQGITAVAVCLAFDVFIHHKKDRGRRQSGLGPKNQPAQTTALPTTGYSVNSLSTLKRLHEKFILTTFTTIVVLIRLAVMRGPPSRSYLGKHINPPLDLPTPHRQLNWLYLSFVNIWLLLNPSQLSADWRFGAVPLITSLTDLRNVLSFLSLVAIVVWVVYCMYSYSRNCRIALFGLSLAVFPFIPASNLFFPVGFVVAERVLYLPSMGFCALVGYGTWLLLQNLQKNTFRRAAQAVITFVLLTFALRTLIRNRDWHSGLTIYSSGVKFNPKSAVMLVNLGAEYAEMGNYSYAEELFRASTTAAPHYSISHYNLGRLMIKLRRYREAEESLHRAIEYGPSDSAPSSVVDSHILLVSTVSGNPHRLGEALGLCEAALLSYPTFPVLHTTRASLLVKLNRTLDAVAASKAALHLNPGQAGAHYYLGLALWKMAELEAAEQAFHDALLIDPSSSLLMLHLGVVLHGIGSREKLLEAELLLLRVLSSDPGNLDALTYLAEVYHDLQSFAQAEEILLRLTRLFPHNKGPLYKLGHLYYRLHNYSGAISALTQLVRLDSHYLDSVNLLRLAKSHIANSL